MKRKFYKYNIAGDDFIIFDYISKSAHKNDNVNCKICNRFYGIGANGIIYIYPDSCAEACIEVFDCFGNILFSNSSALCCAGKWLFDNGYIKNENFKIKNGNIYYDIHIKNDNQKNAAVACKLNMASLAPESLPVLFDGANVINRPFFINNIKYLITCLSIMEPHCVFFTDFLDEKKFLSVCEVLEKNPLFPKSTNIESVNVIDDKKIEILSWKIGFGKTTSYGNGACAAGVASLISGKCGEGEDILVKQQGGNVIVNCDSKNILMTARSKMTFYGFIDI